MEQWLLPTAVLIAALIQAGTALFIALQNGRDHDSTQPRH